jgi:NitT/TauT family transport system permease protein
MAAVMRFLSPEVEAGVTVRASGGRRGSGPPGADGPVRPTRGTDLVIVLALIGLLATVAWLGRGMWAPFTPEGPPSLDLSPWRLPYYAGRSLLRMFLALGGAMAFTFVVGAWAAKSTRAARLILPALDILQSVPVLGFLSATVTLFLALTPGRLLGAELASIFAIFTGQVWNLTFAFYHALITLPREQAEALRVYRLSAWQRFTHFEVPAAVIPLVWNAMMSFGGGWFFLAASEAITVLHKDILLPGLGSYLAVAVKAKDFSALAWALVAMALVILAVDRGLWRPLVAWSEKFKLEESQAAVVQRSRVLDVLRRSQVVPWLGAHLARADESMDRGWRRWMRPPAGPGSPAAERRLDRVMTVAMWSALGLLALRGAMFIARDIQWTEALRAAGLGSLTLLRVVAVLALSALVWTPMGVWIGSNPRVARTAQPIVQLLASFPANFLFPLVAILFLRFRLSIEWGGGFLMMLGAQWYVLFNTIAGAMAIPNDLREMARDQGLRGWSLWRTLILPGIFPAWVTGALTAAGGAWNASIVAEVVSWGDARLTATGIGAYVTGATAAGDWPRIVLGVSIMSLYVVAINRAVWRPLERLAVTRYRLG